MCHMLTHEQEIKRTKTGSIFFFVDEIVGENPLPLFLLPSLMTVLIIIIIESIEQKLFFLQVVLISHWNSCPPVLVSQ